MKNLAVLSKQLGVVIDFREQLSSTNDLARQGDYSHGDIILSDYQTKGRGQRGNHWESPCAENLLVTVILEPHFSPITEQFLLSEAVSLALVDMLGSYGVEAEIKWTNDIYVEGKKIAGILIENDVMGSTLRRSVIGVGLNVNQTVFSPELPNPTSMSLTLSRNIDRVQVLERLYKALMKRYDALMGGEVAKLEQNYHSQLYLLNKSHIFYLPPDRAPLEGIIRRVKRSGELIVEHSDGELHSYLFREIQF